MNDHDDKSARFPEARVAEVLGLTRDEVRAWRKEHLAEGEGYLRAGREIEFTRTGLDAIWQAFGLGAKGPEKKEGGPPSPAGADGLEAGGGGEDGGGEKQAADEASGAGNDPEKKEGPELPVARNATVLVVVSIPRNPRLVLAVEKKEGAAGSPVRVRVRDNRKFVPRMVIRAVPTEADGVFQLAGRSPRYKGRF